jgi:hypothetical protein
MQTLCDYLKVEQLPWLGPLLHNARKGWLSPDGTPTQLQGSDSRPLARRRGKWMRREGEAANIVSLEQETQLRVLQSTEESLYT